MSDVIQVIRNRRNAEWKLDSVTDGIKNYLSILYAEEDESAKAFAEELQNQLSRTAALAFSARPKECEWSTFAEQQCNHIRMDELPKWFSGDQVEIMTVILSSDADAAKKIAAEDLSIKYFVICLGRVSEDEDTDGSFFRANLLYFPEGKYYYKDRENRSCVRLFSVWVLALIQGEMIGAERDTQNIALNTLSGFTYDLVEDHMIETARKNLAGVLYSTEEEQERFICNIMGGYPGQYSGESAIIVETAGYEWLCKQIREKLPDNKILRLLRRLFPVSENRASWECRTPITCGQVVEKLFGGLAFPSPETDGEDVSVFRTQWESIGEILTKTTLTVLCEATKENGIFNRKLQTMKSEYSRQVDEVRKRLENPYEPKGKSLRAVIAGLKSVTDQYEKLEDFHRKLCWLRFVKDEVRKMVADKKLEERIYQLEKWKTQIGSVAVDAVQPDYDWENDVIPSITAPVTLSHEDGTFNRAVAYFSKNIGGRNGPKLLCVNRRYRALGWPSPSRCCAGIRRFPSDTYTFIGGIRDSEMVLLSVDYDGSEGGR